MAGSKMRNSSAGGEGRGLGRRILRGCSVTLLFAIIGTNLVITAISTFAPHFFHLGKEVEVANDGSIGKDGSFVHHTRTVSKRFIAEVLCRYIVSSLLFLADLRSRKPHQGGGDDLHQASFQPHHGHRNCGRIQAPRQRHPRPRREVDLLQEPKGNRIHHPPLLQRGPGRRGH